MSAGRSIALALALCTGLAHAAEISTPPDNTWHARVQRLQTIMAGPNSDPISPVPYFKVLGMPDKIANTKPNPYWRMDFQRVKRVGRQGAPEATWLLTLRLDDEQVWRAVFREDSKLRDLHYIGLISEAADTWQHHYYVIGDEGLDWLVLSDAFPHQLGYRLYFLGEGKPALSYRHTNDCTVVSPDGRSRIHAKSELPQVEHTGQEMVLVIQTLLVAEADTGGQKQRTAYEGLSFLRWNHRTKRFEFLEGYSGLDPEVVRRVCDEGLDALESLTKTDALKRVEL